MVLVVAMKVVVAQEEGITYPRANLTQRCLTSVINRLVGLAHIECVSCNHYSILYKMTYNTIPKSLAATPHYTTLAVPYHHYLYLTFIHFLTGAPNADVDSEASETAVLEWPVIQLPSDMLANVVTVSDAVMFYI